MVDLKTMYAKDGFDISENELPDFLPLFLEYVAHQKNEKAKELLKDIQKVIAKIEEKLEEEHNIYRFLFAILLKLAKEQPTNESDKGL